MYPRQGNKRKTKRGFKCCNVLVHAEDETAAKDKIVLIESRGEVRREEVPPGRVEIQGKQRKQIRKKFGRERKLIPSYLRFERVLPTSINR